MDVVRGFVNSFSQMWRQTNTFYERYANRLKEEMKDQKTDGPNGADVPSSSTDPSTTTVPGAQTPDCSNKDGHQPVENPDHVQYPNTWVWESAEMNQPVVGVQLDMKSKEARKIVKFFDCRVRYASSNQLVKYSDMPTITRIVRIQNTALWTRYYRKRQEMQQKQGGEKVTEKRLFHGTPGKNIDSICEHGFQIDRPAATKRYLGKGLYFTPQWTTAWFFAIADNAEEPDICKSPLESGVSSSTKNSTKDKDAAAAAGTEPQNSEWRRGYMLLSTVLTGRSLTVSEFQGKPPMDTPYDSCFATHRFVQYVVYNDSQVYPEYVIQYQHKAALEECLIKSP